MKFLLTMNQIAYFKPKTTARRLKKYYYQEAGNPVVFLGYLRLIRLLPQLAERAKPLQAELYHKEVREIYLDTNWEADSTGWLALFLKEFRTFFTPEEWLALQNRYRTLHPFVAWLIAGYLTTTTLTKARLFQLHTLFLHLKQPQESCKLLC